MRRNTTLMLCLSLASVLLLSLPFLVPHCGWMALFALVPLLSMERIASGEGRKHFWWWHYGVFVLWNAATTFWVCNATVGGGIFAVLANALQMSLVFGLFRWVKRRLGGIVPYLFLAAAWIAWEKYYLTVAQISWPWLVLGNAFARTTGLVQWYEYLGTLGGSLWAWASNLAVFGTMVALSDGRVARWNGKARAAAVTGLVLVLFGPMVWSVVIARGLEFPSEKVQVVVAQPNIDPYNKFGGMTQDTQTAILLDQLDRALKGLDGPVLLVAPETFTGDIILGNLEGGKTWRRFRAFLREHPQTELLFGASAYTVTEGERPSPNARPWYDGSWIESHNSALLMDSTGRTDLYHKSKLVPGVEFLPYVNVLGPVDDRLLGGVSGRNVGQEEVSNLHFRSAGRDIPVGCAVCYESIYGEFCTGYVRKGAQLLSVITNDAWWGDTPGYRQHLSYSCLRAIETRRSIVRSANTGISALIDPAGRITRRTKWWEPAVLTGEVTVSTEETFFVRYGDMAGRLSVFVFVLLLAAAFIPNRLSLARN